jgi:hypothetical protein
MISVVEYGDNIGTLKNFFWDRQQAMIFVERIISSTCNQYRSIGPLQWYCPDNKEYIKIENED